MARGRLALPIGSVADPASLLSLPAMPASTYPGRLVRRGHDHEPTVRALQTRLNDLGIEPPVVIDGDFGRDTERAVKLFQTRTLAADGLLLTADGEVGPVTWAALFGTDSVPDSPPVADGLPSRTLAAARGEIGKREQPPYSNRGPDVEKYLKSVGLNGGYAWCAAFVHWCVGRAAEAEGIANPLPRTGGVLRMWNEAPGKGLQRLSAAEARADPSLVTPGSIFVMDYGKGLGHTGFVEKVADGRLVTIEGNTNDAGSRTGGSVMRLTKRSMKAVNKGYLVLA